MNRPPALSLLLSPSSDESSAMGSVETPPLLRALRPGTFALWFVLFVVQAMVIVSGGEGTNWVVLIMSTILFACVHVQFWYEESEQGRRFHRAVERMRGRVYEDDTTGLPNSRHFVYELRRQMMRSVRSGAGFSLILTNISGDESANERLLTSIGRAIRHAVGDGDFVARLDGAMFAVIALDEEGRSGAEKADSTLLAIGSSIPLDQAGHLLPTVALTGYKGELEVAEFLRRAQLDLQATISRGPGAPVAASARARSRVA